MQNRPNSSDSRWTIIKIIQWATSYLKSHDIDSPRATGEILLAHALKSERIDLYLNYDQPLVADELKTFKALIKRRIRREPVAYILGTKEFWSLDLEITEDVLIPRPETECLVEKVLDLMSMDRSVQSRCILDLGTGSGAIVIALAVKLPQHDYFASDSSIGAVVLAARNARRHDCSEKIRFFVGDWLAPLNFSRAKFDMIVANPPYIPSGMISSLQPEIHRYEPIEALDGHEDGLDCFRKIIDTAHKFMKPQAVLMMEIGHDQRKAVYEIAAHCGCYENFHHAKDYSGCDRLVWMYKKG
jgi:release factor glutamine methyltransferase